LKVLDLLCPLDHAFEGWFASEEDFHDQLARGLIECPMCGSAQVRKGLSAPRLNLRSALPDAGDRQGAEPAGFAADTPPQALQAAWLALAREIVANTEDVGSQFASLARRMHHGEAQLRGIRGQATPQETADLLNEGIAVLPLPLPLAAKEPLQ